MTPRPNPFAFPSDTDLRFVLLVASVLGASLYIYTLLYLSYPGKAETYVRTLVACEEMARATYPTDELARPTAVQACMAPVYREQSTWVVVGLAALLSLALGLYCWYPAWRIRRGGLQPLLPDDSPELVEYLDRLCREMGLRHPPIFLLSPSASKSGVAFGRLGRYYVALHSGLVTLFLLDRPTFRAVVLHELAHLRNDDVDRSYLSVAISFAFALVALLPLAVVFPLSRLAAWGREGALTALSDVSPLVWPTMALAVSAYLSWTAILRSREHYADLRTLQVDPASALPNVLGRLPSHAGPGWRRAALTHADGAERQRRLTDVAPLLRIGFWDAFAAGIAAASAYTALQAFVSPPLSGTWASAWSSALASVVFVPLAGGVVGLGIWRAAFACLLGAGPTSVRPPAFGLWAGMLAGRALSYEAGILSPSLPDDGPAIWSGLFLAVALLGTSLFFAHWVRSAAGAWLPVTLASGRPRLPAAFGLAVGGTILSLWLGMVFLVASTLSTADLGAILLLAGLGLAFQLPADPLALIAVLFLWAFPLAAFVARRHLAEIRAPDWAVLDPRASGRPAITRPNLRPRGVLLIGAVGGAVSGGLLFVVLLALTSGVPPADEETAMVLLAVQIGVLGLSQATVGALAAARAAHLRVELGLLAACVAGVVQAAWRGGYLLATTGSIAPGDAWHFLSYIVVLGAICALPLATLVSALTAWPARSVESVSPEARRGA